ncbi:hypothetical protein NOVA_27260 [Nocardia nova]|nr:hypothetical protein [Nocardia nova]MBV7706490.1 hypothetical protein [Nocardia nova]
MSAQAENRRISEKFAKFSEKVPQIRNEMRYERPADAGSQGRENVK